MKSVDLTCNQPSISDLLGMARDDVVLVTTDEGDSFLISAADEMDTEVELLRRNHRFLAMLDELKRDAVSIPLAEAEEKLR